MKSLILVCILLLVSPVSYAAHHGHTKNKDSYSISNAYIKAPIAGSQATAAYFTLNNNSAQPITITGAQSPIADRLEVHQHVMDNGLMKMQKVSSVTVKAGDSIVFKPGGYHVMWFGTSKLSDKKSAVIKLILSNGQTIKVHAEVKAGHQSKQHNHH